MSSIFDNTQVPAWLTDMTKQKPGQLGSILGEVLAGGLLALQPDTDAKPDPETGMPGGLGLGTISGLTLLMQDNKDRQMFARMGGPKT